MKLLPRHNDFNRTRPPLRFAREAELRTLPLPARRVARQFGLDASTARLVANLAGLFDGGQHE
jgi:hypothetical protein